MKRLLTSALLATALAAATAAELPAWIRMEPSGELLLDGRLAMRIIHFNETWHMTAQDASSVTAAPGFPAAAAGRLEFKGQMRLPSGAVRISETGTGTDEGGVDLKAVVSADAPFFCNELAWMIALPADAYAGKTLRLGGQEHVLAKEFVESGFQHFAANSGTLELPLPGFRLRVSGVADLLIQDDRKFGAESFSVRIRFAPSAGNLGLATSSLQLAALPHQAEPLSLQAAANMGFADEVADDQRGGWTDQGANNDLRMMPSGRKTLGGIPFDILDPAVNDGKGCLVLAGPDRSYFPKSATIELARPQAFRTLCLLHAIAWSPAAGTQTGNVRIAYADGTESVLPVVAGRNVGDWWTPNTQPEAAVAWTGENALSYVGLYLALFPVEPKPVATVAFENLGNAVWMVVAASAAADSLPRPMPTGAVTIDAGPLWRAHRYPKAIVRGSALDFSGLIDHAPAGKFGFLVNRGGQLFFADRPDQPARFYGTNLNFGANYPSREQAERMAEAIAAQGYNSVRFHHFDHELGCPADAQATIDAALLEKLDYFFHCLKQRGIYLTIDLYISRQPPAAATPDLGRQVVRWTNEYKALLMVSDAAMDDLLRYSRALLTHVNPHTGLAWKDDPALNFMGLTNENCMLGMWQQSRQSGELKVLYDRKFADWRQAHGVAAAADRAGEEVQRHRFLVDLHGEYLAKLRAFLAEIGARILVSDQSYAYSAILPLIRRELDYVDNHYYWDHPGWPMPIKIHNKSAVPRWLGMNGMATRVFGKPFMVTEFSWPAPNRFRAESGPVIGAMAGLQDWSGLHRFALAGFPEAAIEDSRPIEYFDTAYDPIAALSDRIGQLFFLRGDVQAARTAWPIAFSRAQLDRASKPYEVPRLGWQLGLAGRVGTVVADPDGTLALPDGTLAVLSLDPDPQPVSGLPAIPLLGGQEEACLKQVQAVGMKGGVLDFAQGLARSDTGEIEVDAKAATLRVVTPRSESLVLSEGGALAGDVFAIQVKDGLPATFCAAALDGQALRDSARILVLHLTDAANSGQTFHDANLTQLDSWGALPRLVRRGQAEATLRLTPGTAPVLRALDIDGSVLGEVKSATAADGGTVTFALDTFAFEQPVFAYELTR